MADPLRRPLLAAFAALLLVAGCGRSADESPPVETAKTAAPRPRPAPLPENPQRKKLDERGHLLESADDVRGFRLPMGSQLVERAGGSVELSIQTKMERLVQFYTSRGYTVVKGRGGYTVSHSIDTLQDAADETGWKEATLHLRRGKGRLKELLVYFPNPDGAVGPRNALEATRMRAAGGAEAPPGEAPLERVKGDLYRGKQPFADPAKPDPTGRAAKRDDPNVRDFTGRVKRWQEEHPDQQLYD